MFTPLVRRFAIKKRLFDEVQSGRKIHNRPIPRLGGVAIVGAFYVPLLVLGLASETVGALLFRQPDLMMGLLVSGGVIALLGVYDDVRGADATKKLFVQLALALGLYRMGVRIEAITLPFGYAVELGPAALPFTVAWIVGIINAVNLIDGMDGLAGGVALFAVGSIFVMALYRGDAFMMVLMACLGGGVLGFLVYNFNPASIFMGDTGSMFLGLVLAVSAIQTNLKSGTTVAILVPVLVLGLPIADTLLAMGRRAVRGRPLFSADKEHIHHRLLALGLSQRKAVLVLYGACVVFACAALLLIVADNLQSAIVLTALTALFVLFMRKLGYLRLATATGIATQRRRNRSLRACVRRASRALVEARSGAEIWAVLLPLVEDFGANGMALTLVRPGDVPPLRFSTDPDGAELEGFVARFELHHSRGTGRIGALAIAWNDGRVELARDDEIALEALLLRLREVWHGVGAEASRYVRERSANA
jgi:UDP-GlcNAc:undecaprenyl-phosphate GlcNAc-1-phosphate transferase